MKTAAGLGQGYAGRAAVEIESRLLVGVNVSDAPNDKGQLSPTLAPVNPVIRLLECVFVDGAYHSAAAVAAVEQPGGPAAGSMIHAAIECKSHGRIVQELEQRTDSARFEPGSQRKGKDEGRFEAKEGRNLYAPRKHCIEPMSGIIKETLGFQRLSLRSLRNLRPE